MSAPEPLPELPAQSQLERDPLRLFETAELTARAIARGATASDGPSLEQLRRLAPRLVEAPPAALLARVDSALCLAQPAGVLDQLQAMGVLAVLLPEVEALVGFHAACTVHHKDLWTHTLKVVADSDADADMRWVALMHDTGKVPTRLVDGAGKVSFWRHEEVGAFLMRGVGARLGMQPERVERIAFIIRHHGLVNAYHAGWSDRAVRRLMRKAGPRLDEMLRFARVDVTTRRSRRAAQIRTELAGLEQRIRRLRSAQCRPPPLPTGLGHALREQLGLFGPEIGEALEWLEAQVEAEQLPAGGAFEVYLEALIARRRLRQNG